MSLFIESDAEFSPCRTYRYRLIRTWDDTLPLLGWILLNPSTADETRDDPTIRRCIEFARSRGYGGISLCNLYAYRSTDPAKLWTVDDPVGPGNSNALSSLRINTERTIAGWGKNAKPDHVRNVVWWWKEMDCLKINKDGSPMHPLYVAGNTPFQPYVRNGTLLAAGPNRP